MQQLIIVHSHNTSGKMDGKADHEVIDLVEQDVVEISSESSETTNNSYLVDVPGNPRALPRPTFMSWMKGGKMRRSVVNMAKPNQTSFKTLFQEQMLKKYGPMDGQAILGQNKITMAITFCRRIPNKDFQGGKRNKPLISGSSVQPHDKKPDIDNMAKFVLDSLNGVIYKDDEQVVKLVLYKTMDSVPPYEGRTIVEFRKFNPETDLPKQLHDSKL